MDRLNAWLARFVNVDTEAVNDAVSRTILRLLSRRAVNLLASLFGMWTAALPILLWISWKSEVLGYVLASGGISLVLCGLLSSATAPKRAHVNKPVTRSTFETTPKIPRRRSWRDDA